MRSTIVLTLLLLAGCAGEGARPAGETGGASLPEMGSAANSETAQTDQPAAIEVMPNEMSQNRAVVALLGQARDAVGATQNETAGSALERALRIEPRNGWLWHELAQLRQTQGLYAQAVSLARKSNSLSRGERRLQALNWRVIGDARTAQGNPSGAEQAYLHANELSQPASNTVQ